MRVLIADDEARMTQSLADFLGLEGIECRSAKDGLEARRLLGEEAFDLLVSDLRMPGLDGLGLLAWLKAEGPQIPAIMISAHGEVRDAVEAMRLGAYDYLVKPFDPEELLLRVKKAVGESRARGRLEVGARAAASGTRLVGDSRAIKEALRLIEKAAPATATVLLTGESGTGKEVAARLVHELSGREGAFVPVNIGAVPESLLESELFGHEKGAFTGADSRRIGLFETAQRGTLFLDELGELPLHLQVKLLRAIQEKKISRLGSSTLIPVDVRLVAATNRDLEAEMKAGRFREDLYYRINVIRIRLPPLREREGDRSLLAGHFLSRLSGELGRKSARLSAEALELIESYSWPGNVRELENAIERALILAEGPVLEARDFMFFEPRPAAAAAAVLNASRPVSAAPAAAASGVAMAGGALPPGASLAELEKAAIESALARHAWHRERSAAELGITRRTLLNKIKEYGLSKPSRGA